MNVFFPIPAPEAVCDCGWCLLLSLNPLWLMHTIVAEA